MNYDKIIITVCKGEKNKKMEKKNRFSDLLEQLMLKAGLKNNTLAQELQYDVSYISKWVSGRMLPAEKSAAKVLGVISKCIVEALDEEVKNELYSDYLVENDRDLMDAICDNLMAEYNYVKELKRTTGVDVAPKTSFFSELPLLQFIFKMKHPVLRKVKSLEIAAAIDILALKHEYRLMIVGFEGENLSVYREYPGIHFSIIINLEIGERDYLYDPIFIMNMLTGFSNVDFYIYEGVEAYGKIVFAVKDAYAISGMLFDNNHCMSVTSSEDVENCNVIYDKMKSLCNNDLLLFRNVSMREMLVKYQYIQSMLSTNLRWMIGHMSECLLPDDLFEELISQLDTMQIWKVNKMELQRAQNLTQSVMEESHIQIMIYESAFTNFAVSGELDFFNYKIYLTAKQRMRYLEYLLSVLEKNDRLEVKLIHGGFITDFQCVENPSLYMSNAINYLRLDNHHYRNNIMILNRPVMIDMFHKFFYEVWNNHKDVVIDDQTEIIENIHHFMKAVLLLSKTEEG